MQRLMEIPQSLARHGELLTHQKELNEIDVRQLKQLLLNAAEGPMTNPDLVAKRVAAENEAGVDPQQFQVPHSKVSANYGQSIDDKLEKSVDLNETQKLSGSLKAVRPGAQANLVVLRDLRNGVPKR